MATEAQLKNLVRGRATSMAVRAAATSPTRDEREACQQHPASPVGDCPRQVRSGRAAQTPITHSPSERSLLAYFRRYFLPEALAEKSRSTRFKFQEALLRFEDLMGSHMTVAEITEQTLDAFRAAQASRGLAKFTRWDSVHRVRKVVRHARGRPANLPASNKAVSIRQPNKQYGKRRGWYAPSDD